MASEAPTFRGLITAFTDFLTVAIHTILYERKIYPQTSFLSARKYNFAVRQSRHPKVCEWINDAITALQTELLKGGVDRVAIVIFTKDNFPAERFMFDVSRFPVVPLADADTTLERTKPDGEKSAVMSIGDMEEQFRATMSRIANCNTALKSLPGGCTFTLAVELKQNGEAPIGHPQPWMPVQPVRAANASDELMDKRSVPLRAVAAGDMMFESWIEENTAVSND